MEYYHGGTEKKHENTVRLTGLRVENQNRCLPNTNDHTSATFSKIRV